MKTIPWLLPSVLVLLTACHSFEQELGKSIAESVERQKQAASAEADAIKALLDGWHAAASRADGAAYFGAMTDDAVYLGTDASERWTLPEFRAFCEPYFAKGVGWTYVPRQRHVRVEGDFAWFDEKLWNEKYGECRGTGVLRRLGGAWKIAHYSLTFLVPNERAAAVVELLRRG